MRDGGCYRTIASGRGVNACEDGENGKRLANGTVCFLIGSVQAKGGVFGERAHVIRKVARVRMSAVLVPAGLRRPVPKTVAVIGNYLPRLCGIATFTTDLCTAMAGELGNRGKVIAVVMDDIPEGYAYPSRVKFQLRMNVQGDYRLAADFINVSQADVVILEHEYGIFGGLAGSHILRLLRELQVPLLTTLHTVLTEPDEKQRRVMTELTQLSDYLVVMSRCAFDILSKVYAVPRSKIAFIPHGIPDLPFIDPAFHKDLFSAEGRRFILSFGLLSPNKGIENVIQAMPAIVKKYPDALYVCLGATHPHVRRAKGEGYRHGLQRMTRELGMEEHVKFHNRFVNLKELCEYICAADVYVTPYVNEAQITSGALAYALGAGKAVVSTPYWYASEMLDEGRGVLVPFGDADAIAESIKELFANDVARDAMRKRAYQFCREMVWAQVARSYLSTAEQATQERASRPMPLQRAGKRVAQAENLPEVDLRHLRTLTDDVGMLQHAHLTTPNRRHGYCTDDNARALLVASLDWQLRRDEAIRPVFQTYLAFLADALNPEEGRFRNLMGYDRRWLEVVGSEDSHGRALQGLGMAAAYAPHELMQTVAVQLFQEALPACEGFSSPRSWAYSLIGIHSYLAHYGGDVTARKIRNALADRLFELFRSNAHADWPWCEDLLAYGNPSMVHALLLAGQWIPNGEILEQGIRSLSWLLEVQTAPEGHLSIIGNQGWLVRGGDPARFDQQPIEASELVQACCEAYMATKEEHWLAEAHRCLDWFLGRNDLNAPLHDFTTGGCHDGLTATGPNRNQGAESTLAWLAGLLSFLVQVDRQTLQAKAAGEKASQTV